MSREMDFSRHEGVVHTSDCVQFAVFGRSLGNQRTGRGSSFEGLCSRTFILAVPSARGLGASVLGVRSAQRITKQSMGKCGKGDRSAWGVSLLRYPKAIRLGPACGAP